MSALSDAQFAGTEAISSSVNKTGSGMGGGFASQIELGVDDATGKVKLQPAGTNQYKLYDAYQGRSTAAQPRPARARRGVRPPRMPRA